MSKRKKFLSIVLVSILLLVFNVALCSCVSNENGYHGEDGVHAILFRNSEEAIVYAFDKDPNTDRYEGQTCIVPSTIVDGNTTYTVTAFGYYDYFARELVKGGGHAVEIVIPETVTEIYLDGYPLSDTFDYLERFSVDLDNPQFTSVDGVLYNKDCSTLLMYPPAKKDTTWIMPRQLSEIDRAQYNYCNKYLENIEVEDGNDHFSVIDNALYSADAKTLVFVPAGHGENLALPDGISTIDYCALRYANIVNLYVPQHIWKDEENDYQLLMNIIYDKEANLSDFHPFRYVANIYFYDEELPMFLSDVNLPYTEFHFGVTRDSFWEIVSGSAQQD